MGCRSRAPRALRPPRGVAGDRPRSVDGARRLELRRARTGRSAPRASVRGPRSAGRRTRTSSWAATAVRASPAWWPPTPTSTTACRPRRSGVRSAYANVRHACARHRSRSGMLVYSAMVGVLLGETERDVTDRVRPLRAPSRGPATMPTPGSPNDGSAGSWERRSRPGSASAALEAAGVRAHHAPGLPATGPRDGRAHGPARPRLTSRRACGAPG